MSDIQEENRAKLTPEHRETARYILHSLKVRRMGQLGPAFEAIQGEDYRDLLDDIATIVMYGGCPPNWLAEEHEDVPIVTNLEVAKFLMNAINEREKGDKP